MVIIQLLGGLGNQMFQYAAARRVSYINKTSLKFDISDFRNYKDRQYDLDCFNITGDIATQAEIYRLRGPKTRTVKGLVIKAVERYKPFYRRKYIRERHYHFDPEILKVSGNVYLEGYWQSEKYFKDIENVIREELSFKNGPDNYGNKLISRISRLQSVSVHIRRGDYISDPVTNKHHGVCPIEYYYNAVKAIAGTIADPHFFIFSDDISWARDNLKISFPMTFADDNGSRNAYEDLRLMSFCKHHIIANSSFSWWGAWLNADPGKIIYAPKKWFAHTGKNTGDLVPDSWERL